MSNQMFSVAGISASGMAAERRRMEIVANNIANANSTHGPDGQPYRRQHLIFGTANDPAGSSAGNSTALRGVRILGIGSDNSEFPELYIPGHPDANEQDMVRMPNVKLPNEMVDLITASRSYEANLKALTVFKEMIEQTLSLLRGGR